MSHCDLILHALRDDLLRTLGREHWEERIVDDGDCWLWTGYRMKDGHARVTYRSYSQLLHRLMYVTAGGTLLEGHGLHHTCERPNCVNPAHLEQITQREHLERHGHSGLRKAWERRRSQTHCVHGHEMTPENTRLKRSKDYDRRVCRTCERDHSVRRAETPPRAAPPAEHNQLTLA